MRNMHRPALVQVHAAVLLFGLAGILGKLAHLPSPIIVLGRVVFGGAALGILIAARRSPIGWRRRRDLAALAVSGVILAAHWTAFFEAVQVANVAVALLTFSTFPLFTTALEPLLLHTHPRRVDIVAALLILPGMYLVVPTLSLDNTITRGAIWGTFAGFSFALLSIWNRRLTRHYPSAVIGLYQDTAASLVLLPSLVVFRPDAHQVLASLWVLVLLGAVCTALAHTLFIEGMRTLTAQSASVIAALEPVWGIIFARFILDEVPSPRTLVGGLLILSAVILPSRIPLPPDHSPGASQSRRPAIADATASTFRTR